MNADGFSLAPRTRGGWILLIVGLAAALLFFVGQITDNYTLRMIVKPLPVLSMAVFVATLTKKGRYQGAVVVGLLLCMVGDILLEAGAATFLPGVIIFLLGHVAYIVAFVQDGRERRWGRAVLAYGYGVVVFALLLSSGNLGEMTVPVALYVLVICTMLWRAGARTGAASVAALSAQLALLGAVLFIASDTILAVNKWVWAIPLGRYLNISTYWLGQLGITLSARWQKLT